MSKSNKSRLSMGPPFQLFEIAESSEVELSQPFELFNTSDPNFSRTWVSSTRDVPRFVSNQDLFLSLMIDRRSRHQDLDIPLQRLDLNISSPIPSTSAPLIDAPHPIEPQMTNPPSPIHEDLDVPSDCL
ncbi:hypothetical protein DFH28DRAFT_1221806 [Melampsora americana]|nr:hypothetical protein DFH28DRAFT_1221806 [Melampsora americana]